VQEVKRARGERAGLLQSLAQNALSTQQQALLLSTSRLGQRETLREELARSLKHERMGLPLPQGSRLFRDRPSTGGDGDDDDHMLDGSADDDELHETRTGALCAPDNVGNTADVPAPVDEDVPPADHGDALDAGADPLAALAARAMGNKRRKKDRQSLKRHKVRDDGGDGDAPDADASRAAVAATTAALRPAARALHADITGGVDDEVPAWQRPQQSAAMPDPAQWPRRTQVVHVTRSDQVAATRLKLPILGMEQEVMEAVHDHPILLLCGETGCGKTTQVPQFLYEAGYARQGGICVTQPRRVAVTSTAARVAHELGVPLGGNVCGYAVRHDVRGRGRGGGEDTPPDVRFVTDGVLLREAQQDALLSKYTVIVLDEAHERSVNTDILLGLLSRIVPLRHKLAAEDASRRSTPLKLIVMSATLAVDDLAANARLFPSGPPPVVRVPARQFPVTLHFARRTPEEGQYGQAALRKACALHRRLPPGGVLIFMTGAREVETLCAQLRQTFNGPEAGSRRSRNAAARRHPDGSDSDDGAAAAFDRDALDDDDDFGDDTSEGTDDEDDGASDSDESETHMLGGDASPEDVAAAEAADAALGPATAAGGEEAAVGPVHVVPLYAMLSPEAQAVAFQPAPEGHRLVVVATNVAETSLTLPGVRYVIDGGLSKQRVPTDAHDGGTGGSGASLRVTWISQASAQQRAGRAGRTGPGHCYRLYSSAHYVQNMPQHEAPDILAAPLDGVVLHMKAMGIDHVDRFPFPTAPNAPALQGACVALARLGALTKPDGELTAVGASMAQLPVPPRAARFLLAAASCEALVGYNGRIALPQHVLPYAAAVAATLSLDSPFVRPNEHATGDAPNATTPRDDDGGGAKPSSAALSSAPAAVRQRQTALHHPRSDALSAAVALLTFEAAESAARRGGDALCATHGLHSRTLREASQLRRQLARLLARKADELAAAHAATHAASRSRGVSHTPSGEAVAAALMAVEAPAAQALFDDASGVEFALRAALLCGHPDRVARRLKPSDEVAAAPAGRAVRYKAACEVIAPPPGEDGGDGEAPGPSSTVYLHPTSSLRRGAPEWVCYTHIMATGARPYVVGATQVDVAWLAPACPSLTTVASKPQPSPAPVYDSRSDAVVAWHAATYGPPCWPLPPVTRALPPSDDEAAAAFAAALLAGTVSPPMAHLVDRLAAAPATAMAPQCRGQRRVGELIYALRAARVTSASALAHAWRADPAFLRPQLLAWMRAGQGHVLEREWPTIVASLTNAAQPGQRRKLKG
jgi:ATP-dependent RNA helicase DHX37/DHR1